MNDSERRERDSLARQAREIERLQDSITYVLTSAGFDWKFFGADLDTMTVGEWVRRHRSGAPR